MRRDINDEIKQRLIPICKQVEEDFNKFPNIKTTEDFFIWRDQIKSSIAEELKNTDKKNDDNYKKLLRNQIIEEKIKGNNSLELLYAWSKCDRMVTKTKASIRTVNDQYGIEDNDHIFKASTILHEYLKENGKGNTSDLFNIFQILELNLLIKYQSPELRPMSTPYEFERLIFKQEENPWPAPLFIMALKAYGIEEKDILTVGRKFISLGKNYIEDVRNNHNNIDNRPKKYVYTNKGDNI